MVVAAHRNETEAEDDPNPQGEHSGTEGDVAFVVDIPLRVAVLVDGFALTRPVVNHRVPTFLIEDLEKHGEGVSATTTMNTYKNRGCNTTLEKSN